MPNRGANCGMHSITRRGKNVLVLVVSLEEKRSTTLAFVCVWDEGGEENWVMCGTGTRGIWGLEALGKGEVLIDCLCALLPTIGCYWREE